MFKRLTATDVLLIHPFPKSLLCELGCVHAGTGFKVGPSHREDRVGNSHGIITRHVRHTVGAATQGAMRTRGERVQI